VLPVFDVTIKEPLFPMSNSPVPATQQRAFLQQIARQAMSDRGLLADFPAEVNAALAAIPGPKPLIGEAARDLRDRLWCSIDNDDSRDLDQLTVAESLPDGQIKLLVAIADVDALVGQRSPIDGYAAHNTTSVYTAAQIFPMLPERLSTDLTSLNLNGDRLAIVVELLIGADGALHGSDVYRAGVRNRAKLAYHSVAAWLEGTSAPPDAIAAVPGLAENLRLQDNAAQHMQQFRHLNGALSLETIQARPIFDGDQLSDMQAEMHNRAQDLIENCMIAANEVVARYLAAHQFPSLRRVVRTPARWDRIVALAAEHNGNLPTTPDAKALEAFLTSAKAADPTHFPDLSLAVIKLLGAGEYVADQPGQLASDATPDHFGLAVKDYAHSTAPNRRYPDLITQRLIKAAIAGLPIPYSAVDLTALAAHCTEAEDAANKVERRVAKSAAALLLQSRIGETFDAIVTGAADKGTWVRLMAPPVEGKLIQGFAGVDVGQRLRVRLVTADATHGYLDFAADGH